MKIIFVPICEEGRERGKIEGMRDREIIMYLICEKEREGESGKGG